MTVQPQQITEWKLAHGEVYSVNIKGIDYIFRALRFSEYDHLSKRTKEDWSSTDTEEYIVTSALLSHSWENIESTQAGVISVLASEIESVSGYGSPKYAKSVLDAKRAQADEVRTLMKAYVITAMPAYKDDELDELNFSQLATKLALAEQIISIKQGMMSGGGPITLEIVDPEEEALAEEQRKKLHQTNKSPGAAGYNDPIAQRLKNAMR